MRKQKKSHAEVWKSVIGWEEGYMISDKGRLRSLDRVIDHSHSGATMRWGEMLKFSNNKGYLNCTLQINKRRKNIGVHRLVAEAFVPNPHGYKEVNHKNGIKEDNRAINLEWCTRSQNLLHAYSLHLVNCSKGESHYYSKLTETSVLEIRELRKSGMTYRLIAEKFDVAISVIGGIINGTAWKHI